MLSTSTEMADTSENCLSNTEVYNLIVAESFSLTDITDAHKAVEAGSVIGNVIITID